MKEIEIEHPHGILYDSNGDVCYKFGNFDVGVIEVPDRVDISQGVNYVDGPADHNAELNDKYK